ncbi:MAG TPA: hypothetical protein VJY35_16945 [Candidatus Eisenbacteria bacterium]|nr:hypothetical protein [Candidatus Eisenbacteria bacterium]
MSRASILHRTARSLALALMVCAGTPALSAPTPLDPVLFSFPGSVTGPASGASAGVALADRWLGDEPFSNPAVAGGLELDLSGTLLHLSRQDLRARNRQYDETPAFFDGAGVAVSLPKFRGLTGAIYAFQPVLRRENSAFTRGRVAPNPSDPPPATIESSARAREQRAGVALSFAVGPARIGAAAEWNRREDFYEVTERSGSPEAGTRRLELKGDAVGYQLGARMGSGFAMPGAFEVGVGLRYLPALAVDAPHTEELLTGSVNEVLHAERTSGWEGGVSARYVASPAFRAVAGVGGRSSQRWEGFDLSAGRGWEWKLGGEFDDPIDPWSFRFGLGQERQDGVPEPRADVLALGLGWHFEGAWLDLGLVHRTVKREASPNSFDDRVVLTLRSPR